MENIAKGNKKTKNLTEIKILYSEEMKNWKISIITVKIIEICENIRKNIKNSTKFWSIPQKIEYNFFSGPWHNFRKKTKLVLRVEIYNFFPDMQLFQNLSRIRWIFENRKKLGAFYALPFPDWKLRKKQWKMQWFSERCVVNYLYLPGYCR